MSLVVELMNYNIIWKSEVVDLVNAVNAYEKMGWKPKGGVTAIRERISGPVVYIQAVYRNGDAPIKRPRGRPRKNDLSKIQPK